MEEILFSKPFCLTSEKNMSFTKPISGFSKQWHSLWFLQEHEAFWCSSSGYFLGHSLLFLWVVIFIFFLFVNRVFFFFLGLLLLFIYLVLCCGRVQVRVYHWFRQMGMWEIVILVSSMSFQKKWKSKLTGMVVSLFCFIKLVLFTFIDKAVDLLLKFIRCLVADHCFKRVMCMC